MTEYTNWYGLYYIDLTASENSVEIWCPAVEADLLLATTNMLIRPVDGPEHGPGVETGTLIDKSYVCGLAGSEGPIREKHTAAGDG